MSSQPFNAAGYATLTGSRRSADVVLPLLFDLSGQPESVVDFGCAVGAWLAAARDLGVSDYLGLEGGHPEPGALQVDASHVQTFDLERPVDLGRRFDLAISVEVAEHLPESLADNFIASLARHADLALFSAAVPPQGGIDHINEQWPAYWHERWTEHGFECFDVLRWRVWEDERVDWWYRQNLLVYATGDAASRLRSAGLAPTVPAAVVHPDLFSWYDLVPRETAREAVRRAVSSRLRRR